MNSFKMYQFKFFQKGVNIDTIFDILPYETAKSFANTHAGALDCDSFTFTEMDSFSPEQLGEYFDGESIFNYAGELDYEEVRQMCYASDKWYLQDIKLDSWKLEADPEYKNESTAFPVVLMAENFIYDVLDGKHRLGMAKARGEKEIKAIVGKI